MNVYYNIDELTRFKKTASGLYATLSEDLTDVTDTDYDFLTGAINSPRIFFKHPAACTEVIYRSGVVERGDEFYLEYLVAAAESGKKCFLVTKIITTGNRLQCASMFVLRKEHADSIYRKLVITEFLAGNP